MQNTHGIEKFIVKFYCGIKVVLKSYCEMKVNVKSREMRNVAGMAGTHHSLFTITLTMERLVAF